MVQSTMDDGIDKILTNDPLGTGSRTIQTYEGGNAGTLNFNNVVGSFERVRFATKVKRKLGKAINFCARNQIITTRPPLRTYLGIQKFCKVGGQKYIGCSWVHTFRSEAKVVFLKGEPRAHQYQ